MKATPNTTALVTCDEAADPLRRTVQCPSTSPRSSQWSGTKPRFAKALGIRNQSSVDRLLAALHQKGWIQLLPSVERGIRQLREGAPILDPHELPAVAAGNPIVAEDSVSHTESESPRRRYDGPSLEEMGVRPQDCGIGQFSDPPPELLVSQEIGIYTPDRPETAEFITDCKRRCKSRPR